LLALEGTMGFIQKRKGLIILQMIFLLPLIAQVIKGYKQKPDKAWLLHPVVYWMTLTAFGLIHKKSI
jgi:hypothetical protein